MDTNLRITLAVVVCILGLVAGITYHTTTVRVAAFEAGYEQTTAVGYSGTVWQRADGGE